MVSPKKGNSNNKQANYKPVSDVIAMLFWAEKNSEDVVAKYNHLGPEEMNQHVYLEWQKLEDKDKWIKAAAAARKTFERSLKAQEAAAEKESLLALKESRKRKARSPSVKEARHKRSKKAPSTEKKKKSRPTKGPAVKKTRNSKATKASVKGGKKSKTSKASTAQKKRKPRPAPPGKTKGKAGRKADKKKPNNKK